VHRSPRSGNAGPSGGEGIAPSTGPDRH
jgi:hypothetical protein